jgi:hypothetical protein
MASEDTLLDSGIGMVTTNYSLTCYQAVHKDIEQIEPRSVDDLLMPASSSHLERQLMKLDDRVGIVCLYREGKDQSQEEGKRKQGIQNESSYEATMEDRRRRQPEDVTSDT